VGAVNSYGAKLAAAIAWTPHGGLVLAMF